MHAFSSVTPPLDFYINQRHRHRADSGLGGFSFVRPCHSARFMQPAIRASRRFGQLNGGDLNGRGLKDRDFSAGC
jgi:hypothetical protein